MSYIDAKYDLLINGEWVPAEGGETFETFNPATGEKLADCANASPADIDRAVEAARAAFPAWSKTAPAERANLLLKVADLIEANAERLAVEAARAAFPAWSKTAPAERANLLLKVADLIEANAERLAMAETLDNGKPIRETTLVDVPLSVDHFRYFAGCLRAEEGSAVMIDENTLPLFCRVLTCRRRFCRHD